MRELYIDIHSQALGDTIAGIVGLKKYLKDNDCEKLFVATRYMELFREFLPEYEPEGITSKNPFSKIERLFFSPYYEKPSDEKNVNKIHLVEYVFRKLGYKETDLSPNDYNYPVYHKKSKVISPDLILINVVAQEPCRAFYDVWIADIVLWLVQNGLTPVWIGSLGKKAFLTQYPHVGKDLVNRTTIRNMLELMSWSGAILTMDSGLMHLAGCTDIGIVAGFTVIPPEMRLPYRRGKLGYDCQAVIPRIDCRYCRIVANRHAACAKIVGFAEDRTPLINYTVDDVHCLKSIQSVDWVNGLKGIANGKSFLDKSLIV